MWRNNTVVLRSINFFAAFWSCSSSDDVAFPPPPPIASTESTKKLSKAEKEKEKKEKQKQEKLAKEREKVKWAIVLCIAYFVVAHTLWGRLPITFVLLHLLV